MKSTIFLLLLLLIFVANHPISAQNTSYEQVRAAFKEPPMDAWPKVYWWWLNGNIDTVRIIEEIDAMYASGISGFDIFEIGAGRNDKRMPVGKVVFMEDHFLRAVQIAIEHAAQYNMKVGVNMASSWNAGGKWITPEHSAKSMYYSKLDWTGKSMKLPFPKIVKTVAEGKIKLAADEQIPNVKYRKDGKPVYYKEIAVLAIPKTGSPIDPQDIIDVSSYFDPKTEKLNWDGQGEYELVRFICSNSGEQLKLPSKNSEGPIIDHFSAEATSFHFNYILDRLKSVLGPDLGSTALNSLYLASYEVVGNVWTESLQETFKELNGYDINPYLPALYDKQIFPEETMRLFKRDLQYTLSELMINNFYWKAREIANQNGLMINSESGGPGFPLHNVPVEPLKSLGVMDLPRGEFWIKHNRLNADGIDILRVVKEVSSASHIYGREVVEEESFTSFRHWQEGPAEMKSMGDRAFCEGMNRVVVHGWSHNPKGIGNPGIVYGAGTHYNDKRIWWPMAHAFNKYLARLSHVFQQADFYADVLYYYGDAVPNYAGHKNGRFMVGPGYDYEVVNNEILLALTVKDGDLVLPTGATFKLLAMEPEAQMNPEILMKIKELAEQGAKIVAKKPQGLFPYRDGSEIKNPNNIVEKLWPNGTQVKSLNIKKVIDGVSPQEMLQHMNIQPDFTYADADQFVLDYIHYQLDEADFYFIRNTSNQWITRACSFRQPGKKPEIWDPISGEFASADIFHQTEDYTVTPISLAPYGSILVVFTEKPAAARYSKILNSKGMIPRIQYSATGTILLDEEAYKTGDDTNLDVNHIKSIPISGAWEVFFDNEAEKKRHIFSELTSWTAHSDKFIRYYSGIARYVKTFQYDINSSVSNNQKILLDLGSLSSIASVKLNGQSLGVSWTAPYTLDVTETLVPGDNLLEIAVANTWSNRLVGDAQEESGSTFTNITATNIDGLNKQRIPWKDVPLIPSGLTGPVELKVYQLLE